MPNTSLTQNLYQIGAIQFGEFTLKSGQTSPIYLNLRKTISYPALLRNMAEAIWQMTQTCQFDRVCGVPYTALPIATSLSLAHNIPMVMRRKEKKDYGTKQSIEGVFQTEQNCLIIEDVITTGSSIMETANDLEQAGLHITDVAALIDREQGGKEALSKKYRVHPVLTLSDLLRALLKTERLKPHERTIIEQFLTEKTTK